MKGKLLVFSAPSGSGKTTIVRHLLQQDDLNLELLKVLVGDIKNVFGDKL